VHPPANHDTHGIPSRRRGLSVSTRATALVAVLAAGTLGTLGCASSEPALDPNNLPGTGSTVEVRALDNVFAPETMEVRAGTEVVWVNDGRSDHDIEPASGRDWGVAKDDFEPDETYRRIFAEPGEYAYYCTLHGTPRAGMVGTIVVTR
jgi:plastocyanin